MSMYFVQHGIALSKDVDPNRPLSKEGLLGVEKVALHLQQQGITVGKVCHSGKMRALETAEIFAKHLGDVDVVEVFGMSPNDDVIAFAADLEDNVMYVGHLPHMGKLVSCLTAGDENAEVVHFANAGVVCVDKDDSGSCSINWFIKPDCIR